MISRLRCHIDEYITRIYTRTLSERDFCVQGLIQPGLQFDFTESQGLCHAGAKPSRQRQGNRKLAYLHAFSFPVSVIRYC